MEKKFVFIKDRYFEDFPQGSAVMTNREKTNGELHDRPYYCIYEKDGISWAIPVSSQIDKYSSIYSDKLAKYGRCDNIVFGEVLGHTNAFLIQNICPITKEYVGDEFIHNGTPVQVDLLMQRELEAKTNKTLALAKQGKKVVFTDIFAIEEKLKQNLNEDLVFDDVKEVITPAMEEKRIDKEKLGKLNAKDLSEFFVKELSNIQLQEAEERQNFYKFCAGFRYNSYSVNNTILLYGQAKERKLYPVFGTFNEWSEKHKTSIRRGEKGLTICFPHEIEYYRYLENGKMKNVLKNDLSKEEQQRYDERVKAGEVEKKKAMKFFFGDKLFSLTQTNMSETERAAYIQRYNAYNTSDENKAVLDKLIVIAKACGINYEEKSIQDESLGWITRSGSTLVVKEDMPVDSKVSVLAHELGHYMLHTRDKSEVSRMNEELQAQLFSHVAMERLGIDSEKQFSLKYISGYLGPVAGAAGDKQAERLYNNLKTVLPAARLLGEAVEAEALTPKNIQSIKNFAPAKTAAAVME